MWPEITKYCTLQQYTLLSCTVLHCKVECCTVRDSNALYGTALALHLTETHHTAVKGNIYICFKHLFWLFFNFFKFLCFHILYNCYFANECKEPDGECIWRVFFVALGDKPNVTQGFFFVMSGLCCLPGLPKGTPRPPKKKKKKKKIWFLPYAGFFLFKGMVHSIYMIYKICLQIE